MYLNKAIVIGNLTRDPEIKALPSGVKVASFSVATNRVWKDKNGAKQENVDYQVNKKSADARQNFEQIRGGAASDRWIVRVLSH